MSLGKSITGALPARPLRHIRGFAVAVVFEMLEQGRGRLTKFADRAASEDARIRRRRRTEIVPPIAAMETPLYSQSFLPLEN